MTPTARRAHTRVLDPGTVTGMRSAGRHAIGGVTGPVVAVDVIRAFTTAAYAFGAGARVDHFDFAMPVRRTVDGLRLDAVRP